MSFFLLFQQTIFWLPAFAMIVGRVHAVMVAIIVAPVHIAIAKLFPIVPDSMGNSLYATQLSSFYFSIAGVIFKITFQPTAYSYERILLENEIRKIYSLKQYSSALPVDWNITISPAVVFFKKYRHLYFSYWYDIHGSTVATTYNIGQVLFTHLIGNLIRVSIHKKKAFILHSSAVVKNGKAYLFIGPSGIGKSTASDLLGDKMADDLVVVKSTSMSFDVYPGPYIEKDIVRKDMSGYQIRTVCFLKRLNTFLFQKIEDKSEVLQLLISQLYTRKKYLRPQYKLLTDFADKYNAFYYLSFLKEKKAFNEFMKKIFKKKI